MELIHGYETSANYILTPGKYPKEHIQLMFCLTKHWLKEDYLNLIHLDQYKLVSYFSRKHHNHEGSCIFVRNNIYTKNLNCSKDISVEKDFEVSMAELVDYGYIIVCIYRLPDGKFGIFF
jgi:hypothetical protein